jgi:transketolase
MIEPIDVKFSQLGPKRSQREALGKALVSLGEEYPDLFVLSPDVGTSTKAHDFQERFPDRYVCTGIAEMNTVGIAAGLANLRFIPLVAGYAMFIAGKAWEPFRNSIAYPHLNVKLAATHAGINVGPDGVTHQAIEDIALIRSIPGVTILAPGDADQVLPALRRAMEIEGPVYIRIEREPMPSLGVSNKDRFLEDHYVLHSKGEIAIFAIGGMVAPAIEAARTVYKEYQIDVKVICAACIKPINRNPFLSLLKGVQGIITAEDHNIHGGFGSSIAEFTSSEYPLAVEMVGVEDCFASSDDCDELKQCYGLTSENITSAVLKIRERIGKQ